MTLKEMKKKVLALIEELNPLSEYLTDDPDIQAKINDVINREMAYDDYKWQKENNIKNNKVCLSLSSISLHIWFIISEWVDVVYARSWIYGF